MSANPAQLEGCLKEGSFRDQRKRKTNIIGRRGWGSLKLQDFSLQKENLWAPFPSEGKGGLILRFVSSDRILLVWQRHPGRYGAPVALGARLLRHRVHNLMSGYTVFPPGSREQNQVGERKQGGLGPAGERFLGKGLSTPTYCEKENKGTEEGPCPKEV